MITRKKLIKIAGPCAIENEDSTLRIARKLKENGVTYFRGGAFKPRTCPSSFQGLGEGGLKILMKVKEETGMKVVTEILDSMDISIFKRYDVDVLQIGSRNMSNYGLLKNVARAFPEKTILIKRSFSATKKEFIGAINYLREHGHWGEIWACERGIRTFADGEYSRFTMDVNLIVDLKLDKNFKYKIIIDPSHTAGRRDMVEFLSLAGIAAGGDGLIIECKENELSKPICDAKQAVTVEKVLEIFKKAKGVKDAIM
jgi:3-deoxy-7-phosphoheptulonate synthase